MTSSRKIDGDGIAIVLFRHDLRIADNRALAAAGASFDKVVPVFVFDEESPGIRPLGGARRWWLHKSLQQLAASLEKLGAPLVLRKGRMGDVVSELVQETGAAAVFWNRRYDPPGIEADRLMKNALKEAGIEAESFEGHLLHEPWELKTGSGGHYRVYSPFWRALAAQGDPRPPVDAPTKLHSPAQPPRSDRLADWDLLPTKPDWAGGLREAWTPGETGARERLDDFLNGEINGYADDRDRPDKPSTSRLSPHLTHGEITPYQIWQAVREKKGIPGRDAEKFLKEVAWREFSWHLLFHNAKLATDNFNPDFDAFSWKGTSADLKRWQKGETGYPIVDAGMRQLWRTGWMHNRVRMVTASFLIKHLMTDWRKGEAWFWDTLVDADPANNAASWQWVAGSGADAAPYFRIFNPILQGEKFDPEGNYVRAFVVEVGKLPDASVHKPWEASRETLEKAGVSLGETYPRPIVDHGKARQRALSAYEKVKEAS
ncbi:MAG: cryptochrome/photolyase family protein [Rhizobiaceae bacterium]